MGTKKIWYTLTTHISLKNRNSGIESYMESEITVKGTRWIFIAERWKTIGRQNVSEELAVEFHYNRLRLWEEQIWQTETTVCNGHYKYRYVCVYVLFVYKPACGSMMSKWTAMKSVQKHEKVNTFIKVNYWEMV